MDLRFNRKYFIAGALLLFILHTTGAQDNSPVNGVAEDRNYSISWVSQYPALRVKKERKEKRNRVGDILLGEDQKQSPPRRNKNWFSNLLFGKKPDELVKPMAVIAINPDTVWVVDQGTGSILQVFQGVGEITQFRNKAIDDLPSLVGFCSLPDNKFLLTDSKLNQVFAFFPEGRELAALNDSLLLDQPTGIAYSAVNKEIWVVETRAHRITVLNENGELLRRVGERGYGPGQFNFPTYIWIDESGTIYVVDAMNFRIQILDRDGSFLSMFGRIGDSSGYLSRPKGIATDSFGHIYVADALFHAVQVFDRQGNLLYGFGSQGQGKEEFWMPTGIYIDGTNHIYVADSYNSRVQVFRLTHDQ